MQEKKENEGFSVKEIESFAKKNRFQVALGLSVVFACLFGFFMSMMGLSIFAAGLGALLGIFFPARISLISHKILGFICKQEQTTQLVLGAVLIIISIFLSPVIFFILGIHGGKDLRHTAMEVASSCKKE